MAGSACTPSTVWAAGAAGLLKSRTSTQASVSMVLREGWSVWCRRFEAPAASWIESRHGRPTPPREAPSEAGLFSLPTPVDQPLCSLAYLLSGDRRSTASCSQLAALTPPSGHFSRAPALRLIVVSA